MKWSDWLEKWGMTGLKIKAPFLEMDWSPIDEDRSAAWELYVELLTRVTTQALTNNEGDEQAALNSIYSLFPTTRDVMKRNGRGCVEFTKIAVVVLNQIIRPFTAKWHKKSNSGAFDDPEECSSFRVELVSLQGDLKIYTRMLADMAGVEDLSAFEDSGV